MPPFRVLPSPASTKAEHGVRSRVLLSNSDAKALKLSSGDPVLVQQSLVCTIGLLNSVKASTCMLSAEALECFPAGTMVQLQPLVDGSSPGAAAAAAVSVTLSPPSSYSPSTLNYLSRRWDGCIVGPGTKLGVFLGGSFRVFKVEAVVVTVDVAAAVPTTTTTVARIGRGTSISFNVGGGGGGEEEEDEALVKVAALEREEARLVELITTWQQQQNTQSRFPPPSSAIIFGPAGCGKTMLARQVMSRFATTATTTAGDGGGGRIDFVDDIDLLEEDEEENARRDGLHRFLLATNSSATVPEQVRKRFAVELEIAPPTASQRADILAALLAPSSMLPPAEVARIAARAHGFVGADLHLLVKHALASSSAADIAPQHLLAALKTVKPSCLGEAVVSVPNVRWDDIGGMDEVKATIRESVELPLKHPEAFTRLGIRPPNGILLYGPPGCSKTLLAKAVATESDMNFIAVKGPELLSKWVGDSEKAIQATFRRARMSKPCVVFFDEIDALAVQRGSEGGGVSHRVTSQLLQELDGIEPRLGVIVLCATNRPDLLDVALLRPGRIDRLVYVPPPDSTARLEILRINLAHIPHSAEASARLAELRTDGFSGAEVASIGRNAALEALELGQDEVSFAQLEHAASRVQPQITPAVLDFYASFKQRLR